MNSRDTLYLENELEKLAASSPAVVAAVVKPGVWDKLVSYAKDPIVQAGVAIGAGTGISSAMRDYVPLDPTDPRARSEYKRRIGIGAVSGILLGVGASHGMRALSAQVAADISKRLDTSAVDIGKNLGGGLWYNIKDGVKRWTPFMRSDEQKVRFAQGNPWLPKLGNYAEEKTPFNPGHAKQRMKDLAIIGASTGLGGGLGYLAGAALERRGYGAAMSPAAIGLTGAAVGLTVPLLMQYRNAVADEAMEQAGREYAAKRMAERAKISRLLASPQEWSEKEQAVIGGAGKGALVGAGVAGLTHLAFNKFPIAPGLALGSTIGAYVGKKKLDRRDQALAQQQQGYY